MVISYAFSADCWYGEAGEPARKTWGWGWGGCDLVIWGQFGEKLQGRWLSISILKGTPEAETKDSLAKSDSSFHLRILRND